MKEENTTNDQCNSNETPAIMVDLEKCIRCRSCERACKLENLQDHGDSTDSHKTPTFWQRLEVVQVGPEKESELPIFNVYMGCNHCLYPACIASCPVKGKAIKKRKDGVVVPIAEKCVGCGLCVRACPFGIPRISRRKNSLGINVMDKCTYCAHRLDRGEAPACVTKCPTGTLSFGKRNKILKFLQNEGRETVDIETIPDEHGNIVSFDIKPQTIYAKPRNVNNIGCRIKQALIKRRGTSSDRLDGENSYEPQNIFRNDMEFDPTHALHRHKDPNGRWPHLYGNKKFAEDLWDIEDFDWEGYHKRVGVEIESARYEYE